MRVLRALCLIAALIAGAAGSAAQAGSFGGLVLVASEDMPDPRFQETVIYLVDHNENGAFGFVVNKPRGTGPIAALLDELGIDLDDERPAGSITLLYGGPVSPEKGFILHSADYSVESTRLLPGGFALTESSEVLRDIALGRGAATQPAALRLLRLGAVATGGGVRARRLEHRRCRPRPRARHRAREQMGPRQERRYRYLKRCPQAASGCRRVGTGAQSSLP